VSRLCIYLFFSFFLNPSDQKSKVELQSFAAIIAVLVMASGYSRIELFS
jgi:hypothetical protein